MLPSICYVLAGAALICFALYSHRAAWAARNWPTVHGWIIERGLSTNPTGRSGDVTYSPAVKFEYSVEGREFTSDNLYLVPVRGDFDEEDGQAFVDALPGRMPVHYDPQNPARCYLLLHSPVWIYRLLLAFGGFALLVGLAGVLSSLG